MSRPAPRSVRPPRVPSYCRHVASGQGYAKVRGKVIYLGVYGSDASRAAYAAVVADVLSDRPVTSPKRPDAPPATLTVREVCRRYTAFADRYYRRGDRPTTEASIVALACGRAAEFVGDLPVAAFGLALSRAPCPRDSARHVMWTRVCEGMPNPAGWA